MMYNTKYNSVVWYICDQIEIEWKYKSDIEEVQQLFTVQANKTERCL